MAFCPTIGKVNRAYSNLLLPIVCVRAVLTKVVFVLKPLRCRLNIPIQQTSQERHLGHRLQHCGMADCLSWIFSPSKRAVIGAENRWHICWVNLALLERFHDDPSIFMCS